MALYEPHYLPETAAKTLAPSVAAYLTVLATEHPFRLEISASAFQIYEELTANWPMLEGWEEEISTLLFSIRQAAQYGFDDVFESHLRISVCASKNALLPLPNLQERGMALAFDPTDQVMHQQIFEAGSLLINPTFDQLEVGVVILIQPFEAEGDAYAVGYGTLPHN